MSQQTHTHTQRGVSTHVHSHSAGVCADVGAGKSQGLRAQLAQTPHEGMVRDAHTYQLKGTHNHKNTSRMTMIHTKDSEDLKKNKTQHIIIYI